FSFPGIPSPKLIWSAGMCEVLDEMGHSVKFRDLISKDPKRKTLVFFIRHIFCGQCQDFVNHSISELDPVALKQANVDVIIISNGHWQVIKKYRELFTCPFPMFVDGGRPIYNVSYRALSSPSLRITDVPLLNIVLPVPWHDSHEQRFRISEAERSFS
ncbi:hypothetical protein BDY24DRAFT_336102, partial [Mrakia frigida]|uniref:uncharacterized protein n=1 Tax=Mrakia frigida TaxID=29902 RepID=UPI003FCBFDE2